MKPIRVENRALEAPAIKRTTFKAVNGTDPEDLEKLGRYGWCDIEKVRHALNDRLRKIGHTGINDPRDIFRLYGLLNGHEDGIPKVTWHTSSHYELYGDLPPNDLSRNGMFVPAGWVRTLLKFAEAGFVEIVWDRERCGVHSPPEKNTHHHFIGIKADGSRHELMNIGGRYRVITLDGISAKSVIAV